MKTSRPANAKRKFLERQTPPLRRSVTSPAAGATGQPGRTSFGAAVCNGLGQFMMLFAVGVAACSQPIRPEGDRRARQVKNGILFVSEWNEKEEIYVMDADGANVRRLTNCEEFAVHPDW